jgi:AAA+ ATPase superfamily predicted ATPase
MTAEFKHRVADVYGINRDLPQNYVTRKEVDELFVNSLTRDKHLVIYGSSKQGKTSLRKHCLKEDDYIVVHCSNRWSLGDLHSAILKRAGYEVTQSTTRTATGRNKILASFKAALMGAGIATSGERERSESDAVTKQPLELDPDDVNDIIKALGGFHKFIVLEDFHYLSIETQKDFAVALKAFHEQSPLCFIIVGVWLEESRLTVYNGDLTGRVIGINADRWKPDELREVISAGESLLNTQFTPGFSDAVIANCFDSVYIVQEAC